MHPLTLVAGSWSGSDGCGERRRPTRQSRATGAHTAVKRRTLQHSRATALLPDEATPELAAAMPTTPDMRTACSAVTPSAGFGNCEPAHRTVGYRPSGDAGGINPLGRHCPAWRSARKLTVQKRANDPQRPVGWTSATRVPGSKPRSRVRLATESRLGSFNPCDHFSLRVVENATHLPPFMPCRRASLFGGRILCMWRYVCRIAPPNVSGTSIRLGNSPNRNPLR